MNFDCPGYQFLHNKACTFCGEENAYFDAKMVLSPEDKNQEKTLIEELTKLA